MLVLVTESDGEMLLPLASIDYPENTQALLTELANHFCRLKIHPEEIKVSDNLTFALISDFCKKCDIKLTEQHSSCAGVSQFVAYALGKFYFGFAYVLGKFMSGFAYVLGSKLVDGR